ncbi:MAG TPA: serine/threonine-protein kinase [Phycisphaerae bacterium]|nr:serine/threonine-protein kinase [Phycisphaerae bacterium]HRW55637.1 serine/threonine-protein kinase [Phycisphaerae bacterium]
MAADPAAAETKKTGTAAGSQIGRRAVDARLATPDEIQACIRKQEELAGEGKVYDLGRIMVKTGVITASQLKRLVNPSPEDSLAPSVQQIPGFKIMQKIGAGAMASVYKARQLSLDRIVAIKILPKRLSEDAEFVDRFYKEGQAAARMNHNNIVQAIDVGEYGGYHYFVMEFVDGDTVYDHLVKNKTYAEDEALNIILQIARALEHAHKRGLIHRDVKPKNIMITKDGTAKLADMGLARQADDVAAAEAEKGRAFGTPYYISPEQIRGVMDVDFRADIYSLGGTLYHMLTGRVPFEGPTPTAIMQKHLKHPLVPPDHINKSISTGLAEVVERMLAKHREHRYASTTDLIVDLERVRDGKPPLEARTKLRDGLLEDLADGAQADDFNDGMHPAQMRHHQPAQAAAYPVWLAAVAGVEFVAIIMLILIIAFAK